MLLLLPCFAQRAGLIDLQICDRDEYNDAMRNRLLLAAQKLSNFLVPLAAVAILVAFLNIAPPGILSDADAIGYAVCHRLDSHSFDIAGRQLPLCARCTGMYLGAVIGLVFLSLRYGRSTGRPSKGVIAILVLFFLAFAVDGSNSYLTLMKSVYGGRLNFIPDLYQPNNTLRLFTGSGVGLGMAVAIFSAFNQTFWQNWDDKRILGKPWDFVILIAVMMGIDLLVLPEWDWTLYPLALVSSGGVLLLLTMVYSMLWTMFVRQENQFMRLGQAWLPILAGLTITLLQITTIDVVRLWLTHTWGGFPLG